jgi:hypothetical protein
MDTRRVQYMDGIEVVTTGFNIQEQDKEAVLQLATELDRCWNKRDACAFADLFEIGRAHV